MNDYKLNYNEKLKKIFGTDDFIELFGSSVESKIMKYIIIIFIEFRLTTSM